RPTTGNQTSTTFQNLKTGSLSLTATAFPNTDGTGVAQAAGTTPVTILSGQTANISLTMTSTIDHLEISPLNPTLGVGGTFQLASSARNAAGSIVLISQSKAQWSTSNASVASVDNLGTVRGAGVGVASISVKDVESGKTASTNVTVNSQVILI